MFSDKPFDDYSLPIKFDIERNDEQFASSFQGLDSEWFLDIDDFYDFYFHETDNFIITGSEQKFSFGGPLVTDIILSENKTQDGE